MFPPGQKYRSDFPRFGLPKYASRFPQTLDDRSVDIKINGTDYCKIDLASNLFTRYTINRDFHCVTTWSYSGAEWEGIRFLDIYNSLENSSEVLTCTSAVLYSQDGYKSTLLLEDLLKDDVLVADKLNGQPLSIEHGAPHRLVAPEHYGYKNVKHLSRIELHTELPVVKRGIDAFLDHPRGRVAFEERSRWVPGVVLRYVYRWLVEGTVRDFKKAMRKYRDDDAN